MNHVPEQSPGRNDKNPAPNHEDKFTLVRRITGLATELVKLINEILHLFGP